MILNFFLLLVTLYISLRAFPKKTFRFISVFCGPIVRLYLLKRISAGLEDKNRVKERFGIPSEKRPDGKLIWIHAVSVGETLSVIPVIEEMKKENSDLTILLTTTTLTSYKQVEQRLKDKVIHQFIPFDIFMWIRRFIKYWKPSAAFFVESELWPNILYYLHEKDIPTYLLNVRISNRSLKRMYFVKKYLNILPFSLFTTVYVPSIELKNAVKDLGSKDTQIVPNMKTISKKLPVNSENFKKLSKKISDRKAWLAVSTHPGEEDIVIDAHKKLKKIYPNILTIIAIRHPTRKDEVADLCKASNLTSLSYADSFNTSKNLTEDIYILDKIGCLGEFFETIDSVLVCGSLVPGIGGHNFLEPLNFTCNVATGEYIENFRDIYPYVEKYCKVLKNSSEISDFVSDSIEHFSKNSNIMKELNFWEQWKKIIKQLSRSIFRS